MGSALAAKYPDRTLPVAVLGMGHVGIPMALSLAELGHNVIGTDQDAEKMELLRLGQLPFYEPGLRELLAKNLENGRFVPNTDVEDAIRAGTILFVCVGTPQHENGEADLSQVEEVARMIARNLNGYKLVVEKSTVPAITAQWIKKTIERYAKVGSPLNRKLQFKTGHFGSNGSGCFDVASNPEFLQEGKAVQNSFHPERVVCGVESERAWQLLEDLYRPLECTILRTDLNTAELIKHAANAFLATKISFVNMVANLCEAVGADVTKLVTGIGLDPRIGPDFLQPGLGFGGYCLPKDLRAFIHLAESHGVDFSLLKDVERINKQRVDIILKKVRQALWVLSKKTIAVLGLAYKADTDDIREAPSIKLIEGLRAEGSLVRVYDPRAMDNMRSLFPETAEGITYCRSAYEAACHSHAVLLATEWEEFRQLDLDRLREVMEVPILVDGRNLFDPQLVRSAGFEYISVGRQ